MRQLVKGHQGSQTSTCLKVAMATMITLFCCVSLVSAQPQYVGSTLWSSANDICLDGDYAYCVFETGLMIHDISDINNVYEVSRTFLHQPYPGKKFGGKSIFLRDNLAFIAHGASGLYIVDVSDPEFPEIVSQTEVPGIAFDVAVMGDYAYVTGGGAGVSIFNIAGASDPQPAGFVPVTDTVYSIEIDETLAYVTTDAWLYNVDSGLIVIDVSDPENPEKIRGYDVGGSQDIILDDTLLYVSKTGYGLLVLNVKNTPATPDTVDWVPWMTGMFGKQGIDLGVDYLSMATGIGYTRFDVSNPSNIQIDYSFASDRSRDIIMPGDYYAFCATGDRGMILYEVLNPSLYLLKRATQDSSTSTTDVTIAGEQILTVNSAREALHVMHQLPSGEFEADGTWFGDEYSFGYDTQIEASDGYAFVEKTIVDIQDPVNPDSVAEITMNARNIVLQDNLAYLSIFAGSVEILSVAEMDNIYSVHTIPVPHRCARVEVVGDLVYAVGYDSITVFESSGGVVYDSVGGIYAFLDEIGNIGDFKVNEEIAGLLHREGGAVMLTVFGVQSNGEISRLGKTTITPVATGANWSSRLRICGDLILIADCDLGLVTVDISAPESPTVTDVFTTPGKARDLYVDGSLVYIADGSSLLAYRHSGLVSCCTLMGDFDHSGQTDVSDIVAWARWAFQSDPIGPGCEEPTGYYPECDMDNTGQVDVADIVFWANWSFRSGPDPMPCP